MRLTYWIFIGSMSALAMGHTCHGLTVDATSNALSLSPGGSAGQATLRLTNSSAAPEELFVWQLGLSVVPTQGAVGSVSIVGFNQPSNYLLAAQTMFGPTLAFGSTLPSPSAVWSDVSSTPAGGVIAAGGSRNLLGVLFSASAMASGTFQVQLLPADADPTLASLWLGSTTPVPAAFENAGPGASAVQRTVLTIEVHPVPEPLCRQVLLTAMVTGFALWRRLELSK